jgi:hypothetical protein
LTARARTVAAVVLAVAAGGFPASGLQGTGVAVAYMADGTSVPLRSWSLSYEYLAWPKGGSQAFASPARRDGRELWFGRKSFPAPGTTMELQFVDTEREREVDGEVRTVRIPRVTAVSLTTGDGKATRLEPEPPDRRFLMPEADKNLLVQARSLDLRGETITGTRRDLCVITFTVLVECGTSPQNQVVKVEFHQ